MSAFRPRSSREQFSCRVRLMVEGQDEIAIRYAENLSEGGLFVRTEQPADKDALVLMEFVLPDGTPLSRCAAKVVHIKDGQGMGLSFVKLDEVAAAAIQQFDVGSQNQGTPDPQAQSPGPPPIPGAAPPPPAPEPADLRAREVDGVQRTTDVGARGPGRLFALKGPVVGIDLGTVNCCVAIVQGSEGQVITSSGGYETVPSIVHVDEDGEMMVGHPARERMILEPERSIYGSKRFLGRPFESNEVRSLAHFYRYELVAGPEGRVAAKVGERIIPLEEVAGAILLQLRQIASHHAGEPIQRAVVTVPAYFGESQRQAIRDAGRHAGFYVERILNEPTSAAVAYGFGRGLKETVLVYDLGGGTFDASVLRIDGNRMEVLATDGDPFLGGSDFDDRITEYTLTQFERSTGINLREETIAVQRVRFAAEMAKKQLSQATTADISLPFVFQKEDGAPVDVHETITRETLESLTNDLVERTLIIVQKVLDVAQMTTEKLDDVILVGGQTRSPAVRRMLEERFGRKPRTNIHPDEAVALGAARVAEAIRTDSPLELTDVLSASIRVGLREGRSAVLIPRGVRLPAEKKFDVTLDSRSQSETRVVLYRGESNTITENTMVGTLRLPGVPPDEQGARKAEIVLAVSSDGLLSVRAKHPALGDIAELDVLLL